MSEQLIKALETFTKEPLRAEYNYAVAEAYYAIDQLASAATFFHRTAEFLACSFLEADKQLSLKALLLFYTCFDRQEGRNITSKSVLMNAIDSYPLHPAGYYYMSRHLEKTGDWLGSYHYAQMGIAVYNPEFHDEEFLDFKGVWCLLFQSALAAWYCSKFEDAKCDFLILKNNMWNDMDKEHQNLVINNLRFCGVEESYESRIKREYSFNEYTREKHPRLRYKFEGSESIEKNYSQVYQDIFALIVSGGKRGGTYLEIGSADPYLGSNTALLEKDYDWSGVSIEWDTELVQGFATERDNSVLCFDATMIDYKQLLEKYYDTRIIDYLQIDIDPAVNSLEVLKKIPFDDFTFRAITFEHDAYLTPEIREESRDYLESRDYKLFAGNISANGIEAFEDFWIHESLGGPAWNLPWDRSANKVKKAEDFFLSK